MDFNLSKIYPEYDFIIKGASYIGNPMSNTAMFVSGKIKEKISELFSVNECLVFVENGIDIPAKLSEKHAIIMTDTPQLSYARFAEEFMCALKMEDSACKYIFHKDGYYLSEKAKIGENVYIEPGCRIGHHVSIGNNGVILYGTVIDHADIGDNFYSNEYAVIGGNGFNVIKDENGNNVKMPSLGDVKIGNNVEIGAHDNICRGSNGSTYIGDNVKLDAFVHIGHDAIVNKNTKITAGAIVGGYDVIGDNVFVGLNATLRNRIEIGNNTQIGMSAAVLRSVESESSVAGNPARCFISN